MNSQVQPYNKNKKAAAVDLRHALQEDKLSYAYARKHLERQCCDWTHPGGGWLSMSFRPNR